MTREIKFRGKSLETGMWTTGDLIENQGDYYIYHATSETTHPSGDKSLKIRVTADAVSRATVGQYIGLKDNNGREIYEGDIIKWKPIPEQDGELISIVKWCFFMGCFAIYKPNDITDFPYEMDWCKVIANGAEVIGNIYDNQELMEDRVWDK